MTDLKTLALAANAAHPGIPWHDANSLIAIGIDDDSDADFVAATSPDAILKLLAERDRLREALEKLARLGNGEHYGNSVGNEIARQALEAAP